MGGGDTFKRKQNQLWVPRGFAHGFYVLSDQADVLYKVDDYYAPEWERCILWNDPQIGIQWPLLEGVGILLSDKDKNGLRFADADMFN